MSTQLFNVPVVRVLTEEQIAARKVAKLTQINFRTIQNAKRALE